MINGTSSIADAAASYGTSDVKKKSRVDETTEKTKSTKVSGKTIGTPQLSEKAAKYYEELKKKYSNMDFILVSKEEKEQAKSQAGNYANMNKMVVLIDEDKIEKMAEDENYRKQYEGIIANAASGISQLKTSISETGASVKGYGMQVNDNGTASYFAVLEKSSAAQKERIEKKTEENREAKKAAEKKAEKEERQERLENSRNDKKTEKDSDTVTVTASSIKELISKIKDYTQIYISDNVQTESEKKVGKNIDFSI